MDRIARLAVCMLLAACGGESETEPSGDPPNACQAPNRVAPDGSCSSVAVQDDGCAAGELLVDGLGCQPAGQWSALCAEGFVFDEALRSCEPILPEAEPASRSIFSCVQRDDEKNTGDLR